MCKQIVAVLALIFIASSPSYAKVNCHAKSTYLKKTADGYYFGYRKGCARYVARKRRMKRRRRLAVLRALGYEPGYRQKTVVVIGGYGYQRIYSRRSVYRVE